MKKIDFCLTAAVLFLAGLIFAGCGSVPGEEKKNSDVFGTVEVRITYPDFPKANNSYKNGIRVDVKNMITGYVRSVFTDRDGFFRFSNLESGTPYEIVEIFCKGKIRARVSEQFVPENLSFNLGDYIVAWNGDKLHCDNISDVNAGKLYELKTGNKYVEPETLLAGDLNETAKYKKSGINVLIKNFVDDKLNDNLRRKNPDLYLKKVVELINLSCSDDFKKIELAHDFVCYLVTYDYESLDPFKRKNQGYKTVVRKRLGVCAGYARVFFKVCTLLKIPCKIVTGYSRGGDYTPGKETVASNHDWNIVKINGGWYLVDCTWDSHYDKAADFKRVNKNWLFPDPNVAIASHFPANKWHQLLYPHMTKEQFLKTRRKNPKAVY